MLLLCSYNLENISDEKHIARLIECHGYVIIDEPLAVYKDQDAP